MPDVSEGIRNGIEWFTVGDDREECQCARCGGSVEWLNCANCGGEKLSHHECGEDCCACLYPENNVICNWCDGQGGALHCTSSPEWCNANPIPGREHIESTALCSEAWND